MRHNSPRLLQKNRKALFEYGILLVFSLAGAISLAFFFKLMTLDQYRQIVFVLIGFICVFLIIKNPKTGIYLVGATIPMQEIGVVIYGFTVSKLIGLLASYVWFMHRIATKKNPFAKTGSFMLHLAALLVLLALSVAFSELPEMGVNSLLSFIGFILVYMMICGSIEDKNDLVFIFNVLILSSLFIAVIGVLQYLTASPIFEISDISKARGWTKDIFAVEGRVRGTYVDPNAFAMHLVMILPLSIFFFLNERKKIMLKVFYLAVALVFCLAIFLSQSRAAWVALVAIFGCLILFQRKGRTISFLILALFCGFFIMFGTKYSERMQTVTEYDTAQHRDPSITNRLNVYKVSFLMFMDHPVLGVGINQTKKKIVEYGFKGMQTHNLFLLVLVENGVLTLLLFCWILFGSIIRLVKAEAPQSDLFYTGAATSVFSAMIGFIVFGLYHDNFWMSITWYMLGIANVVPVLREKETGIKPNAKETAPFSAGNNR